MSEKAKVVRYLKRAFDSKQNMTKPISARLGDGQGTVTASTPDKVLARIGNMPAIEIYNNRVPTEHGLEVWVGYDPIEPTRFQVLSIKSAEQSTGTSGPPIGYPPPDYYRWGQPGSQPLFVEKRAAMWGGRVTPVGMTLSIYADIIKTSVGWKAYGGSAVYDLSSYVPTTAGKAAAVLVTVNDNAEIVLTTGTEVDVVDLGLENIPTAPDGTLLELAAVRVYTGQIAIQEGLTNTTDVLDLRFGRPPGGGSGGGDVVGPTSATTGHLAVFADATGKVLEDGGAPGASSGHTIQDDGTPLTARAALNIVGTMVTAEDDPANDATKITVDWDYTKVDGIYAFQNAAALGEGSTRTTTSAASLLWWETNIEVIVSVIALTSIRADLKAGTFQLSIDGTNYGSPVTIASDTDNVLFNLGGATINLFNGSHKIRFTRTASGTWYYTSSVFSGTYWESHDSLHSGGTSANVGPIRLYFTPYTQATAVIASKGLTYSALNTSIPPTDVELDTLYGTPSEVGAGFMRLLNAGGAGTHVYLIGSDGTNWWRTEMTKAT